MKRRAEESLEGRSRSCAFLVDAADVALSHAPRGQAIVWELRLPTGSLVFRDLYLSHGRALPQRACDLALRHRLGSMLIQIPLGVIGCDAADLVLGSFRLLAEWTPSLVQDRSGQLFVFEEAGRRWLVVVSKDEPRSAAVGVTMLSEGERAADVVCPAWVRRPLLSPFSGFPLNRLMRLLFGGGCDGLTLRARKDMRMGGPARTYS